MISNTAPSLDGSASPGLGEFLENAANPAGITVASLVVNGSITDPDGVAAEAIAITTLNQSLGTWQYSTDSGSTWLTIRADLVNSTTNELALLLGPVAKIRLLPYGELNGTLTDAITFRAWDRSEGTQGGYFEIAAAGGSTAFSAVSDTVSLTVTAVNDAPTFMPLSGTGKLVAPVAMSEVFVALQSERKIVVAGSSLNDSKTNYDFRLIRLNLDGSLDTSLNGTGTLLVPVGLGDDQALGVAVQADGKMVLAGHSYTSNWDFSLIRLHADGSLDTDFGDGGKSIVPVGPIHDDGYSLAVQADGKIVLGGTSYNAGNWDFSVIRLNADGSLDTGFNGTGKLMVPVGASDDAAYGLTLQADGKIVLAGHSNNGTNDHFSLIRLNTDASLDTGFNGTGKLIMPIGSRDNYGQTVTLQPDGKIVVAGFSYNDAENDNDFSLIRLNADGSLDTGFNGTGTLLLPVGLSDDRSYSVTLQPDGKIVVAGRSYHDTDWDFSLIRLNADGSLDTGFNGTGKLIVPVGASDDAGFSVSLQPDGKIALAGVSYNGTHWDVSLVRVNADGTLDATFNGSAINTLGGTAAYAENAPAAVLDNWVSVYDADLAALASGAGNYSGSRITLARHGGANSQDVFSGLGHLGLAGGVAALSDTVVGSFTQSGGTLTIIFNSNATQARVNEVLSSIGYLNSSDNPPQSITIDWTFSDGNAGGQGSGGPLTVSGSSTVAVMAQNDAPVLAGVPVLIQAATEGEALALADFTVADPDNANLTLTLWASSGQINGLVDGDPATPGIQLSGTAASINTAVAAATFRATVSGAATIDLSLSDGTVSTSSRYSLMAQSLSATAAENAAPALIAPVAPAQTGDGNGDGTPDSQQVGVLSAQVLATSTPGAPPAGTKSVFLTLVADSKLGKEDVSDGNTAHIISVGQQDGPAHLPVGLVLPLGLLGFSVDVGASGLNETFSLYLDTTWTVNGFWQQGTNGVWVNLASAPCGGQVVQEGNKLRLDFEITDGGALDSDGLVNSTISFVGAPGFMPLSVMGLAPDMPLGGFWF